MGGREQPEKAVPSDVLIIGIGIFGLLFLIFAPSIPSNLPAGRISGADFASLSQMQTDMFHENIGNLTKQFLNEHTATIVHEMAAHQLEGITRSLTPAGVQKDILDELMVQDLESRISEEVDLQLAPKFKRIKEDISTEVQESIDLVQKQLSNTNSVLEEAERLLKEAETLGGQGEAALRLVGDLIDDRLARYHADQTDKTDFALYALGARVLYASRTMMTARTPNLLQEWLGIEGSPVPHKRVETMMLQNEMQPGNCWPMQGSQGFALLQLPQQIRIESFSIEHPLKGVNPCHDSTPREVNLYGINSGVPMTGMIETDDLDKDLLATLTYDVQSMSGLQEAMVQEPTKAYRHILMEVLSNYGGDYTCIYRFRAHGHPVVKYTSMVDQ